VDSHAITVRRLPVRARSTGSASANSPERATRSRPSRVLRRLSRVALNLAFVAMIASAGLMLIPAMLGLHRYVIMTGSMTGTYDRGSIVFDRSVPVSGLKVGDPITYMPPPGFTSQTRVTHRIWSIHPGKDGERVFKTKGDANKHPDVWNFTLNQPMQDEVLFHVPEVGYLFLLLSLRYFRMALVGVPALIIGLFMARQLWRDGGEEARRQRLAKGGWQALGDPVEHAVLIPVETPAATRAQVRLDLRMRPVRPGSNLGSHERRAGGRRRAGARLVLRVARLVPTLASGPYSGRGQSSINHPRSSTSVSASTLLVRRRDGWSSLGQRGLLLGSGGCGVRVGADDDGVGDRDHLVDR
jgi:signal peptidase